MFIVECYEIEKNIDAAERESHKLRTMFYFQPKTLVSLLIPLLFQIRFFISCVSSFRFYFLHSRETESLFLLLLALPNDVGREFMEQELMLYFVHTSPISKSIPCICESDIQLIM